MRRKTELEKLQAVWDAKLKKSGFEDAETRDGNLKTWHSLAFLKPSHKTNRREEMESTTEYYRLAGQFLHSHKFKNKSERAIWELHSEGKSVKHFRSRGVRHKWQVYKILKALVEAMKESWKLPQE